MDPRVIESGQWILIDESLRFLVLFVGLVVNMTMSFLLAHGVIPSLVASGDLPYTAHGFRRILYPISAVSLVLVVWAFVTAMTGLIAMLHGFYPRFAI
jgi:hypothetical protein